MKKASILIVAMLILQNGTAWAQRKELIQLQADIIRLTQQVSEIQNSIDDRNRIVQDLVEQVYDRVLSLSGNIDQISKTVTDVQMNNDRLSGEMRILVSNLRNDFEIMDRSLNELRTEINGVTQQLLTMKTQTEALESPEGLMRLALTDFLVGNYELAAEGFREYLDTYPESPRAPEAQLYMGDVHFNRTEFDQAIIEYDLLLQKYGNSGKQVSALYKKGLALAEIGKTQDALTSLRLVISDFPDSTEAESAQTKINDLIGNRRL